MEQISKSMFLWMVVMRKILIVEDEPILRETYQTIISTEPYVCEVAENGKVALEMCSIRDYDLILLDIMMPVMNGIDFLEKYPKLSEMASKIVILSNLSSGKEFERAKELGITRSLVKADTSPRELISTIRYLLDPVQQHRI